MILQPGGSSNRFIAPTTKYNPANAYKLAKFVVNQPQTLPSDTSYNPQQSIIPDPAVYEGETAQALQAYQNALAAIGARRASTLQNYGMTAKVDANGNLTSYGIDPNNQYGAIQQLLGNEGSQITSLQHAAMDRGLGLRGLGAQDEARARFAGGQAQQQLGSQFVGEIGNEAADQYQAGVAYHSAQLQAQRDAIAAAIQNNWFTPVPQSSQGTTQPTALTSSQQSKAPGTAKSPTAPRTPIMNRGFSL
jgi:hypothetical protein